MAVGIPNQASQGLGSALTSYVELEYANYDGDDIDSVYITINNFNAIVLSI